MWSASLRARAMARRCARRTFAGDVGLVAVRAISCDSAHDAAQGVQQYILLADGPCATGRAGVLGSGPSAGRDLELGFSIRGRALLLSGLRRCGDLTTASGIAANRPSDRRSRPSGDGAQGNHEPMGAV